MMKKIKSLHTVNYSDYPCLHHAHKKSPEQAKVTTLAHTGLFKKTEPTD
ncbi:hypothetical protein [Acinetobacter chinensis]|nr:hypothetical protein [Acinetobacter chinensis]